MMLISGALNTQDMIEDVLDTSELGTRGEGWFVAQFAAFAVILFPPAGLTVRGRETGSGPVERNGAAKLLERRQRGKWPRVEEMCMFACEAHVRCCCLAHRVNRCAAVSDASAHRVRWTPWHCSACCLASRCCEWW
jgi:hypothetical protein